MKTFFDKPFVFSRLRLTFAEGHTDNICVHVLEGCVLGGQTGRLGLLDINSSNKP